MSSDIQEILATLVNLINDSKKDEKCNQVPIVNVPVPKALMLKTGCVKENFDKFEQGWNDFLIASGFVNRSEIEKKALLRSVIGEEGLELYNSLGLDENLNSTEVIVQMRERATPASSLVYNRYLFHTCKQDTDSFDDYLLKLRKLLKNCDYNSSAPTLEEHILRDRLIVGIKDEQLGVKFTKNNVVTLQDVIKGCRIEEESNKRLLKQQTENVYKMEERKFIPKQKEEWRKCKYCGYKHEFVKEKCPANGKKCINCKELNHFKTCCPKKGPRRVNEIHNEEQDQNSGDIYELNKLATGSAGMYKELWLKANGKWTKNRCLMDTGATVNVIGYSDLKRILKVEHQKLELSKAKIESFGGHKINVLGKFAFLCSRNNKKYKVNFQVVSNEHGPLLSAETCTGLGLIQVCKNIKIVKQEGNITAEMSKSAETIINQHLCVFEGLGLMEGEVSLEVMEEITPVMQPPRRHAIHKTEALKKEIEVLLQSGVIVKEENHTDWCSNVMLLGDKRKNRIVLDPIDLNKALKRQRYQMPKIEEMLPNLDKAKVFTKLDARKGFWQLKLDEKSSKLTTFWTPWGRYRWLRMPFGISPAPEIFQHRQHELLSGLTGVEVMADDLLVYGKGNTTEEAVKDHNINLNNLLNRLLEKGSRLNKEKLILCQEEVSFYGHIISKEGVRPDPIKVNAIKDMPSPKSKEDVHRFLGMVNYLAKFVENLSSENEELRKLIHDKEDFVWNNEKEKVFVKIKDLVSAELSLKYVQLNEPFIIESDASCFGLGACLIQNGVPVYFASRVLTQTERNYAQIEKELLAIVFACKRFDQFIVGNKDIRVRTDHKPLESIFKKPILNASKRIQVMLLILQRYNLKVGYVPGKELLIPDTLSRAPLLIEEIERYEVFTMKRTEEAMNFIKNINLMSTIPISDIRLDQLKKETASDSVMLKLMEYVQNGWPRDHKTMDITTKSYHKLKDNITCQQGLLLMNGRIIVPVKIRKEIVERLHCSHQGIEYTLNLARDTVYWPGITQQIQNRVENCETCLKFSSTQQKQPMMSHNIPEYPYQMISMDIFEANFKGAKERFLVTVDHFSDFIEVDLLTNLRMETVISHCKKNFSRFGHPEIVCSDGALSFCNKEFQNFAREWEFQHVTSSPYHQQGNGKAESAVKIAKQLINKAEEENKDFYASLSNQRNTPNKTGFSPSQRLMSRRTRCTVPVSKEKLKSKVCENVSESLKQQRECAKSYYDRNTKILPNLVTGQTVMIRLKPGLKELWTPGIVNSQYNDRSWVITVNNAKYRRNREHIKEYSKKLLDDVERSGINANSNNIVSEENNENSTREEDGNNNEDLDSTIDEDAESGSSSNEQASTTAATNSHSPSNTRPTRERKRPAHLKDYVLDMP